MARAFNLDTLCITSSTCNARQWRFKSMHNPNRITLHPFTHSVRPFRPKIRRLHRAFAPKTVTSPEELAFLEEAVRSVSDTPSPIKEMIASRKILKKNISKLAVIQLRAECTEAGLSADGLKAELVDRLLAYAKSEVEKAEQMESDSSLIDLQEAEASLGKPLSEASSTIDGVSAGGHHQRGAPAASLRNNSNSSNNRISKDNETPVEISVQWLGTSSGAPTNRRNVSCIAVRYGTDRIFLVDSGEGTRNQMRNAGINPGLVSHIFITHMHGDHCFGLPGTLSAISNARPDGNTEPIRVYGPPDVQKMLFASYKAAGLQLKVPVIVTSWVFSAEKQMAPRAVDPSGMLLLGFQCPDQAHMVPRKIAETWQSVFDNGSDQVVRPGLTWSVDLTHCGFSVTAAQLQHRMPCWGYVFEEVPVKVSRSNVNSLSNDESKNDNDTSHGDDDEITVDVHDAQGRQQNTNTTTLTTGDDESYVRPGRKLVLLGDTCDSTAIVDVGHNCDLLSHECTFQKGMEEKAKIATHSTSQQAGRFAREIRARNLVLTHFSGRYEQSDKYHRVWAEAKQQGKTMKEMHVSNFRPLLEEARVECESPVRTRVFLASDYYLFRVNPRDPVPLDSYLRWKEMRSMELNDRLRNYIGSRAGQLSFYGSGDEGGDGQYRNLDRAESYPTRNSNANYTNHNTRNYDGGGYYGSRGYANSNEYGRKTSSAASSSHSKNRSNTNWSYQKQRHHANSRVEQRRYE